MLYTLKNGCMQVVIDSMGAEIVSAKKEDCEYIWQGDPAYWEGHAPVMFPICGRVWEGKYSYRNRTYHMPLHGFAMTSEFSAEQISDTQIRFELRDSDRTRELYPFAFCLTIAYTLSDTRLDCHVEIRNTGDDTLFATFGAHPGFCVPINGEGDFSQYYLEFDEPCSPDLFLLEEVAYASGKKRGMLLTDGRRINLDHRMFDEEGLFMHRTASGVTLKSDVTAHSVTLSYPDMPYLGVWHAAKTDAPYVCIEPWCGFAGYAHTVEDITEKPDMFRIPVGQGKELSYSITFG